MRGFKAALVACSCLVLGALPSKAEPSQEIIDKCMKAADFQGCVNVLTGKPSAKQETKITVDMDNIRTTGNSCPANFAYVGSGYCKEFKCFGGYGGHDPLLGGKGNSCLNKRLNLHFTEAQPVRATTDERCPLVEPELGKRNSCWNGISEEEILKGIVILRLKPETALSEGTIWNSECKIEYVFQGTEASSAGIRPGYVVKTINDQPCTKSTIIFEEGQVGRFAISTPNGEVKTYRLTHKMATCPERFIKVDTQSDKVLETAYY